MVGVIARDGGISGGGLSGADLWVALPVVCLPLPGSVGSAWGGQDRANQEADGSHAGSLGLFSVLCLNVPSLREEVQDFFYRVSSARPEC